jgi:hypothetical protein
MDQVAICECLDISEQEARHPRRLEDFLNRFLRHHLHQEDLHKDQHLNHLIILTFFN